MEVTKEQIEEYKAKVDISNGIGPALKNSVVTGAASAPVHEGDQCNDFGFDISVLAIKGQICKSGKIEFTAQAFGMQVAHTTADLSNGEVCFNPGVGNLANIKYCFSFENNCLRTKGKIELVWETAAEWNEEILCF
jgi:hypothetical protein